MYIHLWCSKVETMSRFNSKTIKSMFGSLHVLRSGQFGCPVPVSVVACMVLGQASKELPNRHFHGARPDGAQGMP
jgi:hypothetical protein